MQLGVGGELIRCTGSFDLALSAFATGAFCRRGHFFQFETTDLPLRSLMPKAVPTLPTQVPR